MKKLIAILLALCSLVLFSLPAQAVSASDLLPASEAFAATVTRQGDRAQITLVVAPGYYVYRERIRITGAAGVLAGEASIPPGHIKEDPYFGRQAILTGRNTISVPLRAGTPDGTPLEFRLQGCATAGVCYPPYTHRLTLSAAPPPDTTRLDPAAVATSLATFFLAGIGMAFTACMYPLLPIVSSLIAGEGSALTRRRGFLLSFAYVQGLAVTYTAVGILAGLTGALLTVWLQQPAVILTASLLMVVFALSMFDFYALQLPSALQTRLGEAANRLPGGRFVTVFAMGMLSALLIGPCVAPPLAVALGYIGSTGDAALGGIALYAMAMGLGLPLLVIGTFGGQLLPRAGAWMGLVKSAFGFVMLGVAIWMAAPFLPARAGLVLWALLAAGIGLMLWKKGWRLPALLPVLASGLLLAGALGGAHDPLRPWQPYLPSAARQVPTPPFDAIHGPADLDAALARAGGRPVLLDFYADWCVSCREMEHGTLRDPAVVKQLEGYLRLRADVTANTPDHAALLRRFGLYGPPGIILFDPQGRETDRLIGAEDAAPFAARLARPLSASKEHTTP